MRTYVLRKAGLGNQTAWYSDALTEATQLGDPALSWQDGSQGWRPENSMCVDGEAAYAGHCRSEDGALCP